MKLLRITFLLIALTVQIALAQGVVVRVPPPPPPPNRGMVGRAPHRVLCGLRDTNGGTVGATYGLRDIGSSRQGVARCGSNRAGFNGEMDGGFVQGAGGESACFNLMGKRVGVYVLN